MELSSFSENIVTVTMERSGETAELKVNLDAIVPDYYEAVAERLKPTIEQLDALMLRHRNLQAEIDRYSKELDAPKKKGKRKEPKPIDLPKAINEMRAIQKGIAEINRALYAERLTCPVKLPDGSFTCLLKGWDTTHNGMAIDASKENLMKLPPQAVEAIYNCVEARLETVKKKADAEIEETSENMPNGSREHLKLAPTG